MTGIQGIIVCGEASESEEEEEFCAAVAKGQVGNQKPGGGPTPHRGSETKLPSEKQTPRHHHQSQQHLRRTQISLLHQKLWDTNASLEKNLSQCIRGPLVEQTNRVSRLVATIPAAQTSTLSAHSSMSQASRNLSQISVLLGGLNNNPLSSLKTP